MNSKRFIQFAVLLAVIAITGSAAAQPGTFDPTFNGTGYTINAIDSSWNYPMALCITPEGKILSGGYTCDTTQQPNIQNLMILCYNSDGSPDLGFGVNGMVVTDFASSALCLAVQSDGKILVSGQSKTGSQSKGYFTLFRLNPDGTFDNSFGQGGIVQDTLGSWSSAVTVLPDNRILAAGVGNTTGSPKYAFYMLAMHNPDGTPDTTFGHSGIITTQIPNCLGAYTLGMSVQTNGKILLGDEVKIGRYCYAMVRYNYDGSLDQQFGTGGIVIDSLGIRNGSYKLAVQSNGKILVPGYVYLTDLAHSQYSLFRYNPDGSRDSTFHAGGHYYSEEGAAYDIALQQDGKILTCGNRKNDSTIKRGIVKRYLASGDPDIEFGINGTADLDMEKPGGMVRVAVTADGKIILTGYCNEIVSPIGMLLLRNSLTVRLNAFGVGMNESLDPAPVRISPNPFREKILVEAPGLKGSTIIVTSMEGRLVVRFKSGSDRESINLDWLQPGLYLLNVQSESSSFNCCIIKH